MELTLKCYRPYSGFPGSQSLCVDGVKIKPDYMLSRRLTSTDEEVGNLGVFSNSTKLYRGELYVQTQFETILSFENFTDPACFLVELELRVLEVNKLFRDKYPAQDSISTINLTIHPFNCLTD